MINFLLSIPRDVLCGKLACVQPHKDTNKSAIRSTVYLYIHNYECLSIIPGTSLRSDGRDDAYVTDGTVCGPQMVTKCDILYLLVLCYHGLHSMVTSPVIQNGIEPSDAFTVMSQFMKLISFMSLFINQIGQEQNQIFP